MLPTDSSSVLLGWKTILGASCVRLYIKDGSGLWSLLSGCLPLLNLLRLTVKELKSKVVQEMHAGAGLVPRDYGFVALFAMLTECCPL